LRSDIITLGTIGQGAGFIELKVFCSGGGSPPCDASDGVNEEDIRTSFFQSDVRCQKATSGCATATSDYTGRFIAKSLIRITDHANGTGPPGTATACAFPNGTGGPPCRTATVVDTTFAVPTGTGTCTPVGSTTGGTGSTCAFNTTINTAVPTFGGAVKEFQRGVVSIFGLQVDDVGEDGAVGGGCPPVCGTLDETRAFDQGLFLP
jgi:hypothetical protein